MNKNHSNGLRTAIVGTIGAIVLSINGCATFPGSNPDGFSNADSLENKISQAEFLSASAPVVSNYASDKEFDKAKLDETFDLSIYLLSEQYNAGKNQKDRVAPALNKKIDAADITALKKMSRDNTRTGMLKCYADARNYSLDSIYSFFSGNSNIVSDYLSKATSISEIVDFFSFMDSSNRDSMAYFMNVKLDEIISSAAKSKNYDLVNEIYLGMIFYNLEVSLGKDFGTYSVRDRKLVSNSDFAPYDFTKDDTLKEKEAVHMHRMLRSYFSHFERYEGQLVDVFPGKKTLVLDVAGEKTDKSGEKTILVSEYLQKLFDAKKDVLMGYLFSRYASVAKEVPAETSMVSSSILAMK